MVSVHTIVNWEEVKAYMYTVVATERKTQMPRERLEENTEMLVIFH